LSLHRIWSHEPTLRELCGGEVGALVDALTEADDDGEFELELKTENGELAEHALWIVWTGKNGTGAEHDGDREETDEAEDDRDPYAEDEGDPYGDDGSHRDYTEYDDFDDLDDLDRLEQEREGRDRSEEDDDEGESEGIVTPGDHWNLDRSPDSASGQPLWTDGSEPKTAGNKLSWADGWDDHLGNSTGAVRVNGS
jgi:hypothetical protein